MIIQRDGLRLEFGPQAPSLEEQLKDQAIYLADTPILQDVAKYISILSAHNILTAAQIAEAREKLFAKTLKICRENQKI